MKSRRSWNGKEDEAFAKLAKETEPKNWSTIAKRLASEFGFKKRSGKQCRERWYNHLIPGISKKVWSTAEEEKLLLLHKSYGNKWTIIAEYMPGRTDNSIKNYFYSTVRRSLRRMGKLIGSKNSTSLMRSIKPSTLTQIFSVLGEQKLESFQQELQSQFQSLENLKKNCENVRDEIIQFSSYKPKKTDEVDESERNRYENVFEIILKLNSIYQKFRGFQKVNKSEQQIFREDFKQMMKQDSENGHSSQNEESIDEDSQGEIIPKSTKTRTRNIKLPEKLCLGYQNHVNTEIHVAETNAQSMMVQLNIEKDNKEKLLYSIKEQDLEEEMNFVVNTPQYGPLIEEIDSQPHFQIELKDENNFNLSFQNYQHSHSPNFYFGTPADRVNFFKSPLAAQTRLNSFTLFNNVDENVRGNIEDVDLQVQGAE